MSAHKSKKRKTDRHHDNANERVDTSKPSAVFKPTKGRKHTTSIALPGSIIANAATHDQKNALAGAIARACAVFCVDEVVVFDDGQVEIRDPEEGGYTAFTDPNFFLYHILSYLETPPHLRKALFPMHRNLRTAGALPSLDMPHHLRSDEWCPYREGIAVGRVSGAHETSSTLLDCGLSTRVTVPVSIEDGTRLTVKLDEEVTNRGGYLAGEAVSPDAPREEVGYYWGYSVRQAASLGAVFTECAYDGGYDFCIGTSERGAPLRSILATDSESSVDPTWSHLLVVFGGVAGLEVAFAADDELQRAGAAETKDLFDRWINLVPGQGSRTIRTEEAIWIGLTGLRPLVEARDAA